MTPELGALAGRVEVLTGPDREVDCLIWCTAKGITPEWQGNCLVAGYEGVIGYIDPGVHQRNFSTNRASQGPGSIPAYTASLDAAMTLVPEGCWAEGSLSSPAALEVHAPMTFDPLGKGWAATPALALCAAALRASTPTQNHKGPHDE